MLGFCLDSVKSKLVELAIVLEDVLAEFFFLEHNFVKLAHRLLFVLWLPVVFVE
jgi:hypothetical protein